MSRLENVQWMIANNGLYYPLCYSKTTQHLLWNSNHSCFSIKWFCNSLYLNSLSYFFSLYAFLSESFIHVSSYNMSWENALDYCNSQPNTSGLLRIESVDDQIETERELKRQKISGPVWVGLRQSRLFGFWIWYNGLYVGPWTNWKEGSAPEHLISEHCGALEKVNGQYKWCDKDCRSKFKVLCEGNNILL